MIDTGVKHLAWVPKFRCAARELECCMATAAVEKKGRRAELLRTRLEAVSDCGARMFEFYLFFPAFPVDR